LTFWLLALWRADLRIPFAYGVHDELTVAIGAKWLIENPWIFSNPHLGMPFGSTMFNFAQPDVFHYLVVKLLGLTTRHFGLVMNLFYLLTFPATCLSTMYVLRQFRLGYPAAFLGSLLYTFLPYHFLRGEIHLFLSAYYLVPLVALVTFTVASDAPPFFRQGPGKWPQLYWRQRASFLAIIVCVIAGSSGVYYAFFDCFLIMITGIVAGAARRRLAPLFSAIALTGLIALTVLLCLSPHLIHRRGTISSRVSGDAETYALKITQLLLPVSGHRLTRWAALKNDYYHAAPLVNENDAATLGLVGSAGFLLLLGWTGLRLMGGNFRWLGREDERLLDIAALLTLAATLLATIGGLGSIFALLVSPQIRSYNRISVYIAFFALLAIALALDRGLGRRMTKLSSNAGYLAVIALLTAMGLADQTTPGFVPNYRALASAFRSDARFVRSIEKQLPPGAMVFQLPYRAFPEASSYDLARGYLHSRTLRWSYGAMANERSDFWQRDVQWQPVPEMVRRLAAAGFSGIYIDRKLYPDNGASFERDLSESLGQEPLVSVESALSFFNLEIYKAAPHP
jgi:phosphoglycerol transferase